MAVTSDLQKKEAYATQGRLCGVAVGRACAHRVNSKKVALDDMSRTRGSIAPLLGWRCREGGRGGFLLTET